jgi:hypothetical protein
LQAASLAAKMRDDQTWSLDRDKLSIHPRDI